MKKAVDTNDEQRFKQASEVWSQAQGTWLIIAQHMTPGKAHAVMVGFATAGELNTWMEQEIPGPPPCVFDLYKQP